MEAGTNSSDFAFAIANATNTVQLAKLYGDGGFVIGSAGVSDEGAGTINVSGGYYVNGTAIPTAQPAGANPSKLISLTTANGSAATFMRSDAAPAIDQSIGPTWTGGHTFTPSSNFNPININLYGNSTAITVQTPSATQSAPFSFYQDGLYQWYLLQPASTNAWSWAANGANVITHTANGGIQIGAPTGGDKGAGTLNLTGLYLNGVNQLQSGTFTGTLTGMSAITTGTINYSIAGKTCTLACGSIQGTTTASAVTMTGLPAACQPATQTQAIPCTLNESSTAIVGVAIVAAGSGTITFYPSAGSNWSAATWTHAANTGFLDTCLTYSLL
jgi:hypothetical protein